MNKINISLVWVTFLHFINFCLFFSGLWWPCGPTYSMKLSLAKLVIFSQVTSAVSCICPFKYNCNRIASVFCHIWGIQTAWVNCKQKAACSTQLSLAPNFWLVDKSVNIFLNCSLSWGGKRSGPPGRCLPMFVKLCWTFCFPFKHQLQQ